MALIFRIAHAVAGHTKMEFEKRHNENIHSRANKFSGDVFGTMCRRAAIHKCRLRVWLERKEEEEEEEEGKKSHFFANRNLTDGRQLTRLANFVHTS